MGCEKAILAERVGFEPTLEFPLNTLSKRAPSTTRPSLQDLRNVGEAARELQSNMWTRSNLAAFGACEQLFRPSQSASFGVLTRVGDNSNQRSSRRNIVRLGVPLVA